MPNVKIYVDEVLLPGCRADLMAALPVLRAFLCEALTVEVAACQFAVLPVLAMADLPRVNVELQVLAHPDRTRAKLIAVAERVQAAIGAATRTHTAVRIAMLASETYVALK